MSARRCPICGASASKAIFAGFPVLLCDEVECRCLFGFWSWVPGNLFPFNGWLMLYTGSYLRALWAWLRAWWDDDDDDDAPTSEELFAGGAA